MTRNVVIYHNPDCGTSRNVVALVKAAGYEPTIINYLDTGWSRPQLLGLFAAAGLTPRSALRESAAKALGFDTATDEEILLQEMLAHPVLVNRPIVCTPKGVRLCRPSETVLDLLEQDLPEPFYKEDGELVSSNRDQVASRPNA